MDNYITDRELIKEFCLEHYELFMNWIDTEHDIDPLDADFILDALDEK